jgi:hypothetical protein
MLPRLHRGWRERFGRATIALDGREMETGIVPQQFTCAARANDAATVLVRIDQRRERDRRFDRQAIQSQNRLSRLLEFGSYFDSRRVREWCREHLGIIEAIASDNFALASTRMRTHLVQALASVQAVAKQAEAVPISRAR